MFNVNYTVLLGFYNLNGYLHRNCFPVFNKVTIGKLITFLERFLMVNIREVVSFVNIKTD